MTHPLIKNLVDIPESEYHAATGSRYLSSHRLGAVIDADDCGEIFNSEKLVDASGFLRMGSMVHSYTLEGPQQFLDAYIVGGPKGPRGGVKAPHQLPKSDVEAWHKKHGKPWVTPRELKQIEKMAASVWEKGGSLFHGGWPEKVARIKFAGVNCQIRVDWISAQGVLCDLKTCSTLDVLHEQIAKFRYIRQLAFYQTILALATNHNPLPVVIIGVEKRKPYRAKLVKIQQPKIDQWRRRIFDYMETLYQYLENVEGEDRCQALKLLN